MSRTAGDDLDPHGSVDPPVLFRPETSIHEYEGWKKYSLADWIIAFILIAVAIALTYVSPHHMEILGCDASGNNCNNVNLGYQTEKDQISTALLAVISFIIPLAIMWFFAAIGFHGPMLKDKLYAAHNALLNIVLSLLFAIVVTTSIKKEVGWPRPNFLDYCGYANGVCNTLDSADARSARESFPSGHASTCFAGCVYLSLHLWYITDRYANVFIQTQRKPHGHLREYVRHNQMWRFVLCMIPVFVALGVSVSRIRTHLHYPADIVGGACIGTFFGFAVFFIRYPLPAATPISHRHSRAGSAEMSPANSVPQNLILTGHPSVSIVNQNLD